MLRIKAINSYPIKLLVIISYLGNNRKTEKLAS